MTCLYLVTGFSYLNNKKRDISPAASSAAGFFIGQNPALPCGTLPCDVSL